MIGGGKFLWKVCLKEEYINLHILDLFDYEFAISGSYNFYASTGDINRALRQYKIY